jgi:hypothetical protein
VNGLTGRLSRDATICIWECVEAFSVTIGVPDSISRTLTESLLDSLTFVRLVDAISGSIVHEQYKDTFNTSEYRFRVLLYLLDSVRMSYLRKQLDRSRHVRAR